jgi:hypothetical protein
MIRWLSIVLRRPAIRPGPRVRGRGRATPTRNGQFVSFLQQSGFRRVNLDRYERSLRWRRAMLTVGGWAAAVALVWVLIESAQALTLF